MSKNMLSSNYGKAFFLFILVTFSPCFCAKKNPHNALARELLRGYKAYPPPNKPTIVRLGIYVNYFYAMNEQSMDYQLSFYMRQQWTDSRLTFDPKKHSNITKLRLDDSIFKDLWVPDVFFRNEKGASYHKVTQQNRLLFINESAVIWYVSKISATFSCPMKLYKYPMDTQSCPLRFESFGYTTDTIVYKWLDSAVEFEETAKRLPEIVIDKVKLEECHYNDTSGYQPGEYPCLELRFIARRSLGYFLIQFYIPSILLVMLSWVSFWISVDAVVARVSLGLLTVLNLVTQSTGSRNQFPKVSYVKAIDVWMTACLVFAFASLIEFAVVNVWSRTEARKKKQERQPKDAAAAAAARVGATSGRAVGAGSTVSGSGLPPEPEGVRSTTIQPQIRRDEVSTKQVSLQVSGHSPAGSRRQRRLSDLSNIINQPLLSIHQHRAQTLDQLSRIIFPCAFVLFNAMYWIIYSLIDD